MSYSSAPDPSMTPKEEEEFLLIYGPRKVRKALKKRRKAEQEASKKPEQVMGFRRKVAQWWTKEKS